MKIPIKLLREFVEFNEPIEKVANSLFMAGIEVSSFTDEYLEVEVLPNRGDCLSVIGIAREISAILDKNLKFPKMDLKEIDEDISKSIKIEVKNFDLCSRYMARVIKGVQIKESPQWLQDLLITSGLRPINNVVDATNFVMVMLGQPLHAFDLNLIEGKKVIVRNAKTNEKIVTIDGVERNLDEGDLVIADEKKPIAIAGVMGGQNSEINNSTKDILIESAYFSPISISKTSKKIKLRTEASIRFERSVDVLNVETALDMVTSLILQLAGGNCLRGKLDVKKDEYKPKIVSFDFTNIKRVLGIDVEKEIVKKILKNLGFVFKSFQENNFEIEVPSWRLADVEREIDIIEEIARIYGYDHLKETFTYIRSDLVEEESTSNFVKKEKQLRQLLASKGFYEAKTYSMCGKSLMTKLGIEENSLIKITNPLIDEMTHLRSTLLLGLLSSAKYNVNREIDDIALFEIGKIFVKNGDAIREINSVAGILYGSVQRGIIEGDKINEDFYFVKGIIEDILLLFNVCCADFEKTSDTRFENKMAAEIFSLGEKIGFFGLLNKAIASSFDLVKPVYIFELNFDKLLKLSRQKQVKIDLPKYPSIKRDVAMFIPSDISHREIQETILMEGGSLIEEVILFDKFSAKGKTSIAYRIVYRSKEKTLTDEEVNFVHEKILSALQNNLKIEIRK